MPALNFPPRLLLAALLAATLGCGGEDIADVKIPEGLKFPDARPQVTEPSPVAITRFTQWTESEMAADSLGRIGVASVPGLVVLISSPGQPTELRHEAIEILGRIGPAAAQQPGTIPTLQIALEDPDPEIRMAAARALGQMGPEAAAAVPELLEMFQRDTETPPQDAGQVSITSPVLQVD